MKTLKKISLWILLLLGFSGTLWFAPPWTSVVAQQPTGSIPTVTGTPSGPFITAKSEGANVRAGPSSYDYPVAIGYLVPYETAPVIGRSPGEQWFQIIYLGVPGGVGWVYAPLVTLTMGGAVLPIIEPPPTPTPQTTPTINPTYAAAFQIQTTPTRLPTFTPPPPLETLSFEPASGAISRVPMGFVILGLALVGILGAVISFLRGR